MSVLATLWVVLLALLLVKGQRDLDVPEGFASLAPEERLEWISRAWEAREGEASAGGAPRVAMGVALVGALVWLLGGLERDLQVWMMLPASDSSLRVGAGLLAVWVGGMAVHQLAMAHWRARRLGLAREYLTRALERWDAQAARLFQELLARRPDHPAPAFPVLLRQLEAGPGGLPYSRLRLVELTLAEDRLLVTRSPVLDARRQSQYLAIDPDHSPHRDLDPEDRRRIGWDELVAVDFVGDDGSARAERGVLRIELLDGETVALPASRQDAEAALASLRSHMASRARLPRREGVVLLDPRRARAAAVAEAPEAVVAGARRECPECAELV